MSSALEVTQAKRSHHSDFKILEFFKIRMHSQNYC